MKKIILLLVALSFSSHIYALAVGDVVKNVDLKDSSDNPTTIEQLGKKVITVFYTDPDVSDQNDTFADMLKAEKLPKDKYAGVGIGNLKDTIKPNFIIRAVVRKKEKKFNSKILTDPKANLKQAWNLGDCDGKSVVIVIDRAGKVHYIKKGALTKEEGAKVLALIKSLL